MTDISIVIPVYNSQDNLLELIKQISDQLANYKFEVILVNDQSLDESWSVIANLVKSHKEVMGVNLRKNSGQDNAIFAGLHYVNGEYIVIMDDDLQHSPSDIDKLYREVIQGYDACYANFSRKNQSLWKNYGSWLNGKMAEIVIEKPKNIYLSPFKIIKKDVVKEIVKTNYLYPYIDGIIFSITNNISQINVKHHCRYKGVSNYTIAKSIKVFMKLTTGFSVLPLRAASFFGLLISIFSTLLGLYFIVSYFSGYSKIDGWTSLVVILLFLGGVILLSIGMIGEYLGRMYLNTTKIKPYTIKDEVK